jgi:raffinose/stachyose/melibiose transport system permease protein
MIRNPSTQRALMMEKRKTSRKWYRIVYPWLLLTPSFLLLLLVISGPVAGTVWLSLTDWNGIAKPNFIGFANFAKLLSDKVYYASLLNTFKWMIVFLTVPILVSLLIAVWLSKIVKGQMLYRALIFIPYIISTVVTAKIWQWIYNPYVGINFILERWGLDSLALLWLGDQRTALYAVAFADGWHGLGFNIVLFLVALHQTDKSYEEAGKVEGASNFQIFWHIILPQLRPTITLIYMLTMIWSFAAFDYVYIMTQGGPGNASELIATYMYKMAIYNYQPGFASAVAMTMGLFSVIVIIGFGYLRKKGWDV